MCFNCTSKTQRKLSIKKPTEVKPGPLFGPHSGVTILGDSCDWYSNAHVPGSGREESVFEPSFKPGLSLRALVGIFPFWLLVTSGVPRGPDSCTGPVTLSPCSLRCPGTWKLVIKAFLRFPRPHWVCIFQVTAPLCDVAPLLFNLCKALSH